MKSTLKKYLVGAGLLCGIAIACYVVFFRTASAYIEGAQNPGEFTTGTVAGYLNQAKQSPWLSSIWTAVSQWFQNTVAQGEQSTGAPAIPITISGPLGSSITVSAQNLFAQIDTWLYGIVHIHIALVVDFLFGFVGWILNIAKDAVDWLNSIFKSAAGR